MVQNTERLITSFDNGAIKYDEDTKTFHHKIANHVIKKHLLLILNGNKNWKILDSGGGTSKYSIWLKKLGYNVHLSDISSRSIEIASRKIEKLGLDLPLSNNDSEKTLFKNSFFDFVMLNGAVISYTQNPEKLLKEANRILKINGQIFFDFFNSLGWAFENENLKNKVEMANEDEKLIQMSDWDYPARVMSIKKIEIRLNNAGFRIINEMGLICLSHTLPLNIRYSNNIERSLIEKYKDIEFELSKDKGCVGSAWSCIINAEKIAEQQLQPDSAF